MSAIRYGLGLDLGLRTGWCVWDYAKGGRLFMHGTIDVRKLEGEQERMAAWGQGLVGVLDEMAPEAVGFEEVRHMVGQGARYILMQQGVLLHLCNERDIMCAGINVATLKAWARRYYPAASTIYERPNAELPAAPKSAADMQYLLGQTTTAGPAMAEALGEDEVMAAWVALWLGEAVTSAP